ncbi:MAG: TIGR02452 family protein [Cyanobacteria bacterium P01_A01_bin.84]
MSLKGIAQETLQILEKGEYISSSGKRVEFLTQQRAAVEGTTLYTPEQGYALLEQSIEPPIEQQAEQINTDSQAQLQIEVTDETTQVAARRLVQIEGCTDLVLLNFASARNAGGGFINGAKAQEEDLTRCSGLYPCLLTQPTYYKVNRTQNSLLYTDHLIYSPAIPWFRTQNRELLEDIFLASVITAPAPNAGQVLRRDENAGEEIEKVLRRRAGIILAVAQENGHRSLLLGAWGCGVFRNNPNMVADAFGKWLVSPRFSNCFERVVFAVYDSSKEGKTLKAFQRRFDFKSA